MISYIKGEVVKKGLDYIVLENNNIGYFINTSLSTLNKLSEKERDNYIYAYKGRYCCFIWFFNTR